MIVKVQNLLICALLPGVLLASIASNAYGWATITVNSLADPGQPGICTLRDAITAANTMTATNGCRAGKGHDTIVFSASGTITLADTLPEVVGNLTINGAGITITGGIFGPFMGGVGEGMEVGTGATLNLNNITIANGGSPSTPPIGVGFGCIANLGTLTVTSSTFSSNGGDFNGFGGVYPGCIFNQGTATITNSVFSDNSDDDAIVNQGALTVSNSRLTRNQGRGDGGIINEGTANITTSTFSSNGGGSELGIGAGAIRNSGTMAISNSTFVNNSSADFGGGILNGGQLIVINSTFSGNSAGEGGGAIANGGDGSGGGGAVSISNSTFLTNVTTEPGGAGGGSIFGAASLRGTIVAGKPADGNCAAFGSPAITDLGYNISDDDSCGFSAIGSQNNTDPMLDPAGLANNGGPTQTIALISGSPALDTIPLGSCIDQNGAPLTTDQRGFSRPDAGEQVCDIGAYEFEDFAGTPGSTRCYGESVSALSHQYRNLKKAASAMGFRNVRELQNAIRAFCSS